MFWHMAHRPALSGRTALFSGPRTPLAQAVARRVGLDDGRMAFVGPSVSRDPTVRALQRQFPGRVLALDSDLPDPESAQAAAADAERSFGRIDLWIHTVGSSGPIALIGADAQPAAGVTPLGQALTCSLGAAAFMGARQRGHIVHLVTRADVGALEVESLAVRKLRDAWPGTNAPAGVSISTIVFDESVALPSHHPQVGERGLLEMNTARIVEEDDWAHRVFVEREIGNVVVNVFMLAQGGQTGALRSFEFPSTTPPAGQVLA